ncbi:MAG: Gfo/Idh/MocA family oxidoreductase [Planctomycetota bacterium]|nr:Gfo/Idh/MocA family oxidoreductase [Planctomycetota bacterium]
MRINFRGQLADEPEIRAGFIGCGSHSFRNIFPTFQFAPVNLVATCDLVEEKARAFAKKFGAERSYTDYREMLAKEKLDAVFLVLGADKGGRPLYPKFAVECLKAGVHVFIEKPPAATTADVEAMREAAAASGKFVMCGLKKMFVPANRKAKELTAEPDFGPVSSVLLERNERVPAVEEFEAFFHRGEAGKVAHFLDHLCHPTAALLLLLGMPETLYYERSRNGSALLNFSFASGAIASLAIHCHGATDGGMERIMIVSETGRQIVVENSVRLYYHRSPPRPAGQGYGNTPSFFNGQPGEATTLWEPEFSLGQLYSKGLFLLGFYDEVNEFARAILEKRRPCAGTLDDMWGVTRIFEAMAAGPRKLMNLQPAAQPVAV